MPIIEINRLFHQVSEEQNKEHVLNKQMRYHKKVLFQACHNFQHMRIIDLIVDAYCEVYPCILQYKSP